MMSTGSRSFEETPTWAIAVVCFFFILISITIEAGASHLAQFFRRKRRKSFNRALQKIKAEMMILGFISFLLTVSEVPISKICVSKPLANSFLPCQDIVEYTSTTTELSSSNSTKAMPTASIEEPYCEVKGMVSLVSRDGIQQLNVFISFLAMFHILYCLLTMLLGLAKIRRWQMWEEETRTLEYNLENDTRRFSLTRQTSFGQRHLKFWSNYTVLLWLVSFVRQFSGSVSKVDYFTLRYGFITAHMFEGIDFNFQKFLARAFDDDFEKVVGISFWIWIYSVLFIFASAHVFYNHYWLPVIPLMITLVIGTKLEVIITKMCWEDGNGNSVTRGMVLVKPNNKFFWFNKPDWLLHLLQFILFQNSFQLAFFIWTWYEYGPRSCFNRETEDITLRIVMSVVVQCLCGYVTLPLSALVTQMGSDMKPAVFTDRVAKGIKRWRKSARHNLRNEIRNTSTIARNSSKELRPTQSMAETKDSYSLHHERLPPIAITSAPSRGPENSEIPRITEITELQEHDQNPSTGVEEEASQIPALSIEIITRGRGGAYDGEISFASTWKELGE